MSEWWHRELVVRRFVSDVVAAEMARLRPTGFVAPPSPFDATLSLSANLGIDSLELVAVASALNDALHLYESGVEDRLLMQRTIGDWVGVAIEGLTAWSSVLTFSTSGSMGAPKRCKHRVADLHQEAEEFSGLLQGRTRVLTSVRSHHIYGFIFTVALPHVLALASEAVVDLRYTLPSALPSRLREGDLVVGYPDFWAAVARAPVRIPPGVVGVTSTAPCPSSVAREIERAGLEQLVQIYGSTETAGVGVRTAAEGPFTLLNCWRRTFDEGRLMRTSGDGRETTKHLPDVIEWNGDRTFWPVHRLDDVVQVAGVNVSLSAVRLALTEHPHVRDAAVRLMSTELVPRVKAFIVPRDATADAESLRVALDGWISERLPVTHRPRAITFGRTIPVNALGKSVDWPVTPPDTTSFPA